MVLKNGTAASSSFLFYSRRIVNFHISILCLFFSSLVILNVDAQDIEHPSTYTGPIKKFDKPVYTENSPRIHCESPTIDFGVVPQRTKHENTFTIKNEGKSDLIIYEVKPTGYNITADMLNKTIPPGENSDITVTLDSGKFSGKLNRSVQIISNDPVQHVVTIPILATIELEFNLEPYYFSFGNVSKEKMSRVWYLTPEVKDPQTFEIISIEVSNPHIEVKSEIQSGDSPLRLALSLKPSLPFGPFSGIVTVHSNNIRKPTASFKISGNREALIKHQPSTLHFHMTEQQPSNMKTVVLNHIEKKIFNVVNIYISDLDNYSEKILKFQKASPSLQFYKARDNDVKTSLRENTTPGLVRIDVTFQRHIKQNDFIIGQMTIITDDPGQKEVKIPFYAFSGPNNPLQQRLKRSKTDTLSETTDINATAPEK